MRLSRLPRIPVFFVALFFTASSLAPLPYVVVSPGAGTDVLANVIKISGAPTYATTGKLLVTTVLATSPDSHIFGLELLYAWMRGTSIVLPRDVVYPPEKTAKQIQSEFAGDMKLSQDNASSAALGYLGFAPSQSAVKVTINLKATGGPSGGLIFALGIIEKLSPIDFLHGRVVAGTGTIDLQGAVGPIGGIDEKLIAAKNSGASVFLAPSTNCNDVHHIPGGLKIYSVSSLKEAVSVLKDARNSIPHCTWQ